MESDLRFDPETMRARGYDPGAVEVARQARLANDKAASLIEKIEAAFVNIPRPRITLRVARGFDDEWHLSEEKGREYASQDPELDWREVSDIKIETYQEYFTFGDDEGRRFYLPAFLRHYLHEFPYCGHDTVYWACTKPEQFGALTLEQTECVKEFMELCYEFRELSR